ncbi:hypothetical protein EON66_05680 [archaeon]|nr:MAG: hypothetical protein EON66_05680 [archaeon]
MANHSAGLSVVIAAQLAAARLHACACARCSAAPCSHYETTGTIYTSIAISYALQALYVADSVFCEESILTTMDIIMDGFGFMLAFGDLAWVPFMYSLQCRYLAEVPTAISPVYAALCLAVGVAGFYIFRAANMQKDTFKKNPNDASINRTCATRKHATGMPHAASSRLRCSERSVGMVDSVAVCAHLASAGLRYIPTERGTRLLAGGWWGIARHINYFGDWLLSVGMSMPTGA